MGSPLKSQDRLNQYAYGANYGAILEYLDRKCRILDSCLNKTDYLYLFDDRNLATRTLFFIVSRLSEIKDIEGEQTFRKKCQDLWDICLELSVHGSYAPDSMYEIKETTETLIKQMNKWVARRMRLLTPKED